MPCPCEVCTYTHINFTSGYLSTCYQQSRWQTFEYTWEHAFAPAKSVMTEIRIVNSIRNFTCGSIHSTNVHVIFSTKPASYLPSSVISVLISAFGYHFLIDIHITSNVSISSLSEIAHTTGCHMYVCHYKSQSMLYIENIFPIIFYIHACMHCYTYLL